MADAEAAEAFQRQVLAELAAVKADNIRLSAELEHLRAAAPAAPSARGGREQELSRRGLLRQASGVVAAGAGLAAAGSVLGAQPAAAHHTGGFGHSNEPREPTGVHNSDPVHSFHITNYSATGTAISCRSFGSGPALVARNGESAAVDAMSILSNGVVGTAGSVQNVFNGVYGVSEGLGNGVFGEQKRVDGTGNGVLGISSGLGNSVMGYKAPDVPGDAVVGIAGSGRGVLASSVRGVTLEVAGTGRLRQALRPAGTPTVGAFSAGEQIRDAEGELWLCVADGSPGTWRRAATVKEGFQGGSLNLLRRPVRLFDSRSGAPLAGGARVDIQVVGVNADGVPAGAKGVLGNVTVVGTTGPGGYLTLYAEGAPPDPATSNINWFGPGQNLSTSAVVALNPATGKLTIHNGIVGGSNPTHVLFDVAAFVF